MDSLQLKKRQYKQYQKSDEDIQIQKRPKYSDQDEKLYQQIMEQESAQCAILCGLCDRNITKSIKIKCFQCVEQKQFSICYECVRTGQENEFHKSNHDYYVMDNLNFNLLSKDWTAKEDILLIQGIMKCGLGNWQDISEQYVKTKCPKECEEHYFTFFYKNDQDKMPQQQDMIAKGKKYVKSNQVHLDYDEEKIEEVSSKLELYQNQKKQRQEEEEQEFLQQNQQMEQNKDSQANQNNQNRQQKQQRRGDGNVISHVSEVVGYMPKRGEFDQEYDMDADLLLADMEFFDDDTENDIQLKNDVIELYNARLDERIRRKKFVIERGILDFKRIQKYERKKTKEEREIINTMKIFARFNSMEDHERLVNGLIKERLLREVIEQLKLFKSRGLTTLDQIEQFIEIEKKKKNNYMGQDSMIQPNQANQINQNKQKQQQFNEIQEFIKNPNELINVQQQIQPLFNRKNQDKQENSKIT